MVAFTRPDLIRWIAPIGGLFAGIVVAAVFLLMPVGALEDLVWRSGVASLMTVAQPPLGATARAVLALAGGALAASLIWSALFLLFGAGGFLTSRMAAPAPSEDGAPTVRRADAHPDAPARKPLSAADLGVPMPPVAPQEASTAPEPRPIAPPPVVQPLPADLDTPIGAFDPAALLPVPREPSRPVAPLKAPALAKGERIASVELPSGPRDDGDEPSIESLLRRLEQGARSPRRAAIG